MYFHGRVWTGTMKLLSKGFLTPQCDVCPLVYEVHFLMSIEAQVEQDRLVTLCY